MEDKKTVDQQQLEKVSGGFEEQTAEIRKFIRKHDPGYRIDNDFDIMRWLMFKSGIGFSGVSANVDFFNSYSLSDGTKITHEELMKMLNERFPE